MDFIENVNIIELRWMVGLCVRDVPVEYIHDDDECGIIQE